MILPQIAALALVVLVTGGATAADTERYPGGMALKRSQPAPASVTAQQEAAAAKSRAKFATAAKPFTEDPEAKKRVKQAEYDNVAFSARMARLAKNPGQGAMPSRGGQAKPRKK